MPSPLLKDSNSQTVIVQNTLDLLVNADFPLHSVVNLLKFVKLWWCQSVITYFPISVTSVQKHTQLSAVVTKLGNGESRTKLEDVGL